MMETILYPPNAILFVCDMANENLLIPEYVDDNVIAANQSCVSVATHAHCDGDVVVRLEPCFSSHETGSCSKVFSGLIDTPTNRVAVITSGMDKVLENNTRGRRTRISIWTDDTKHPGVVLIEAEWDKCTRKLPIIAQKYLLFMLKGEGKHLGGSEINLTRWTSYGQKRQKRIEEVFGSLNPD